MLYCDNLVITLLRFYMISFKNKKKQKLHKILQVCFLIWHLLSEICEVSHKDHKNFLDVMILHFFSHFKFTFRSLLYNITYIRVYIY